jgi:hypothetical protein
MLDLALWVVIALGLSYGTYRGLSWLASTKDLVPEAHEDPPEMVHVFKDGFPQRCPACHAGKHVQPWMYKYDKGMLRGYCYNCHFTGTTRPRLKGDNGEEIVL